MKIKKFVFLFSALNLFLTQYAWFICVNILHKKVFCFLTIISPSNFLLTQYNKN